MCGNKHTNEDGDNVVCNRVRGHWGLHSDGDERWQ